MAIMKRPSKGTASAKGESTKPVEKKDKRGKKDDSTSKETAEISPVEPKFGPLPGVTKQRLWSRSILILGLMVVVYFSSGNKEEVFADSKAVKGKSLEMKCQLDNTCGAKKCGRLVTDVLLSGEEAYSLIDLSRRVFVSHPGISVANLHDKLLKMEGYSRPLAGVFEQSDALVFKSVKGKLQQLIASHFGVEYTKLNLAGPSYLSMYRPGGKNEDPVPKVHSNQYSFAYSASVFLTQHERDVDGGKLVFVDNDKVNRTILPVQGRSIVFSSGPENTLYFDKVTKGLSYVLTLGFTCSKGVSDPSF